MDFLSQYENLQIVSEGETKAFRARRVSDQRTVLLHQLSSNPQSRRQVHLLTMLLRHSASLRPGSSSPILGIEEQDESVWVITEDRPEMVNLLDWMDRQAPAKSGSNPSSPTPPESIAGNAAGRTEPSTASSGSLEEKTVLFATRLAAADSSPVVDVDATLFTGVGHHEPESSNKANEATRALPVIKLPAPPVNEAKPQSQDSTAMFQAPASAANRPEDRTRAIPTPPSPSSEATVFMQSPASGSERFSSPPPQQPLETPVEPSETAGEFTMLFRKPPAALAGEQKPRFMGFTAPTPEKARFIESAGDSAPLPDLGPIAPPGQGEALKPSGSFTFRPPAASEPDKTQAFELPSFPSTPAEETWPPLEQNQPGEFTQVFQRPPASARPEADRQEPGAFTRIFQIPVGSDLLSAPESQGIFSGAAAPPAISSGAADPIVAPPIAEAPRVVAESAPKAPVMPAFKAPAIPSVKAPAIPAIPPLHAGGGGKAPVAVPAIPKVSAPKAPALATPKMPAMPKAPKLETPAAGAGPSILPLVLIFGGIVLVAVLVVLFFVTKH